MAWVGSESDAASGSGDGPGPSKARRIHPPPPAQALRDSTPTTSGELGSPQLTGGSGLSSDGGGGGWEART